MATINLDNGAVWDNTVTGADKWTVKVSGQAGRAVPVASAGGAKPLKLVSGTIKFDASYPAGGEDISGLWDLFPNGVQGIVFAHGEPLITANAKVLTVFAVDYVNKKLLVYGDDTVSGVPAEVAAATDLSTLDTVRFLAWGN